MMTLNNIIVDYLIPNLTIVKDLRR
jgi:hypothetical protein